MSGKTFPLSTERFNECKQNVHLQSITHVANIENDNTTNIIVDLLSVDQDYFVVEINSQIEFKKKGLEVKKK